MLNKKILLISVCIIVLTFFLQANEKKIQPGVDFRTGNTVEKLISTHLHSLPLTQYASQSSANYSNMMGLGIAGTVLFTLGTLMLVGGVAMFVAMYSMYPAQILAWQILSFFATGPTPYYVIIFNVGIALTVVGSIILLVGLPLMIVGFVSASVIKSKVSLLSDTDYQNGIISSCLTIKL